MLCRTRIALLIVFLAATWGGQIASAQTLVGSAAPGEELRVPLDQFVPSARLRVEIDGDELFGPFRIEDGALIVVLPPGLTPGRHDLTIWTEGVVGRGTPEVFLFDAAGHGLDGSAILSLETGIRTAQGGATQAFAQGSLGVRMSSADNRTRLGFRLTRPEDPLPGSDKVQFSSFFLETSRALGGVDLTFRLGDHYLDETEFTYDGNVRRGISLGIANPSDTQAANVFALRPSDPDSWDNALGLGDSDDLVVGLASRHQLGVTGGVTLTTLAYDGNAPLLPDGNPGETSALGLGLTALTFGDRAVFSFDAATSRWDDGGGPRDGTAVQAGVEFALLPPRDDRDLTFGVAARRVESDFYSALYPGLIRGEKGVTLAAEYATPFWDISAEADIADTNVAGDPGDPTDRLTEFTLDAVYDPNDFTGGWMHGMTFFAGLEIATLDRRNTPVGATSPNDNTYTRLSFGADRFRDSIAWSASVSLDRRHDDTGAGLHEHSEFIDLLWSWTEPGGDSLALALNMGERTTPAGRYGEAEVSAAYRHVLANPSWAILLNAGFTEFEDPSRADGAFASAAVEWKIREAAWLVFEAEYGTGTETPLLLDNDGWQAGLYLRADVDLLGGGG